MSLKEVPQIDNVVDRKCRAQEAPILRISSTCQVWREINSVVRCQSLLKSNRNWMQSKCRWTQTRCWNNWAERTAINHCLQAICSSERAFSTVKSTIHIYISLLKGNKQIRTKSLYWNKPRKSENKWWFQILKLLLCLCRKWESMVQIRRTGISERFLLWMLRTALKQHSCIRRQIIMRAFHLTPLVQRSQIKEIKHPLR